MTSSAAPTAQLTQSAPRPNALAPIQMAAIDVHPLEPRARLTADPELIQSIREHGLLQPIVVGRRAGEPDKYLLLAGHRRFVAMRELGAAEIPATVLDIESDGGGRVLLAENLARRDFTALEEAEIVGALLDQKLTYRSIADSLGRSIAWVARRANLRNLSPSVRRAIAAGVKGEDDGDSVAAWPPAWLEELALLDPRSQDLLLDLDKPKLGDPRDPARGDLRGVRSIEQLRELVASELRPLRLAKWGLDDAALVPAVGACLSCPKTSAATPTLFGDVAGEGARAEDALCRDPRCWSGKHQAWFAQQQAAAVEKHGRGLALTRDPRHSRAGSTDSIPTILEPAQKVFSAWDVQAAKKGEGIPALVVDGPRVGQVIFVQPNRGAPAAKKAPVTPEERRAQLTARRAKALLEALMKWVEGAMLPELTPPGATDIGTEEGRAETVLVAIARAVGEVDTHGLFIDFDLQENCRNLPRGKGGAPKRIDDVSDLLWCGLRRSLVEALRRRAGAKHLLMTGEAAALEGFEWLIELTGFNLKAERTAVERQHPAPDDEAPAAGEPKPTRRGAARGGGGRKSKRAAAPVGDQEEVADDSGDDEGAD